MIDLQPTWRIVTVFVVRRWRTTQRSAKITQRSAKIFICEKKLPSVVKCETSL